MRHPKATLGCGMLGCVGRVVLFSSCAGRRCTNCTRWLFVIFHSYLFLFCLRWCMEDGTWCCGKEIRVFFLIIIYELSWVSSVNRHLMMVEMFPNEPRSCVVLGNWPLLRPPKENWFKVKCQTMCSSPRALWIKLITRIRIFGPEGSQGSVMWVGYPVDPPTSGEITRVWTNHSWSCTRWEVESWWRLIIRSPTIFQYVTVGPMHLGEWIPAVCSYVRNSWSPTLFGILGKDTSESFFWGLHRPTGQLHSHMDNDLD